MTVTIGGGGGGEEDGKSAAKTVAARDPAGRVSAQSLTPSASSVAGGGILAESMGLGKTVEVLACVLAHRRPAEECSDASFADLSTTEETTASEMNDSSSSQGGSVGGINERNFNIDGDGDGDDAEWNGGADDSDSSCAADDEGSGASEEGGDRAAGGPDADVSTRERKRSRPSPAPSTTTTTLRPPRYGSVEEDFRYGEPSSSPCVCGNSGRFRGCLSWVRCDSCGGRMHGSCAGFTDEEELVSRTRAGTGTGPIPTKERACASDRCPCCFGGVLRSGATLIVTPPSILAQWQREIDRHTAVIDDNDNGMNSSPLRVVVYPGMKEMAATKQFHLAHPKRLAGADVVVTTFDALMADLGHSSAENPYVAAAGPAIGTTRRRGLRKRKRYRVVPSPLTSVEWWRVCLDEAQRIETPTAASARMALHLSARHRWCVSGTPVGRGKLDDLYGLLLFLGSARPFDDRRWFRACFSPRHRGAVDRIGHALSEVLWRSTKSNDTVRRQMGVPEQAEKKVYLQLSSVEMHFYKQQLEKTIEAKNERDARVGGGEGGGGKKKAAKWKKDKYDGLLSQQIHRLRAACCHPQVGSSGIRRIDNKRGRRKGGKGADAARNGDDDRFSPNSRVLSMDQILDRLVTDAKKKCEESQRIVVMHTNGLASLGRLKVEAKKFGRPDDRPDAVLLGRSVKSYLDNLRLIDENATPMPALGEATLLGCVGFRSSRRIVRDGRAVLDWQQSKACGSSAVAGPVWAKFDFDEGFGKRITALSVRCIVNLPGDLETGTDIGPRWKVLKAKNCVLQAGIESLGGSFVDVYSFNLPASDSEGIVAERWRHFDGFISDKSKSWRVVINNYHNECSNDLTENLYIGLEVRLMEDEVATDPFQRMHNLHNVSLALSSLMQCGDFSACEQLVHGSGQISGLATAQDVVEKLEAMTEESQKLEKVYMERAVNVHRASQLRLAEAMNERENCKHNLDATVESFCHLFSSSGSRSKAQEGFDKIGDAWFEDFLSLIHLHGSANQRYSLCELVHKDLSDFYENFVEAKELETTRVRSNRFPSFNDVDGLHMAFNLRMHDDGAMFSPCAHFEPVERVSKLSSSPTLHEIHENSCCQKCRVDWNQTGPVCSHCKLEDELLRCQMQVNDPELMCVLKSMAKWLKGKQAEGSNLDRQLVVALNARASRFFDLHDKTRKVVDTAKLAWRTHFDLLSDLDELKQTKASSRLPREGEDLSDLSKHEAGFVVQPCDISAQYMDNEARQAMAMADLRRNMNTLRYLRNQKLARKELASGEEKSATCVVCLSPFDGDRAVLSCGHYFHESPCLERLIARGGGNTVSCPMRCARTRREDVFIATNKRKDDGSQSTREVKGCWGTKVDRLVGDIMDVSDLGQKAVVFSQWDDFLSIIEAALEANGVNFIRPKSGGRKFGDAVKTFRSSSCSVILMNVKNGAEGLTLVEATHVFMVEPLLNCGLDMQAVNRIHRIGQAQKTYVHRYLVQNTVEEKIDRWRMERQKNHFEDDLREQKKHNIKAGGIDGGFSPSELHDLLH